MAYGISKDLRDLYKDHLLVYRHFYFFILVYCVYIGLPSYDYIFLSALKICCTFHWPKSLREVKLNSCNSRFKLDETKLKFYICCLFLNLIHLLLGFSINLVEYSDPPICKCHFIKLCLATTRALGNLTMQTFDYLTVTLCTDR